MSKKIVVKTREELDEIIKNAAPDADLNHLDVSHITDMSELFLEKSDFNGDISQWDVSNVVSMSCMFQMSAFNGDISQWDVSNVTDMSSMFVEGRFNGDISQWDVSNVVSMCGTFGNSSFNGDISRWNVSNVTDMASMFSYSKFNQDISEWNVSNVTDMGGMFSSSKFNQDISEWDVSNVTIFEEMFMESEFSGNLDSWNVSKFSVFVDVYMFDDSPLDGNEPSWYKGETKLVGADDEYDDHIGYHERVENILANVGIDSYKDTELTNIHCIAAIETKVEGICEIVVVDIAANEIIERYENVAEAMGNLDRMMDKLRDAYFPQDKDLIL